MSKSRNTDLEILPAFDFPQEVRALFSEYTQMLIAGDSSFAQYLALRMYKRFGFYEIPCYNNSPMESSIYMKLDLKK